VVGATQLGFDPGRIHSLVVETGRRFASSVRDAFDTASARPVETETETAPDRPRDHGRRFGLSGTRRTYVVIGGLFLVLAVPLVVALISLLHPRWYPLLDMAWTEMRLRDVWSSHPPLLGLATRIGPAAHPGSHPGPLSFYVLWPFYELFGGTSWAMEAASVALHLLAIGALLWIANRRGGLGLVLGLAAVLAILLRGFGVSLLTQAWNPYLPVLVWLVFLLAVWSVFCDDIPLLPVAVLAGSFCAQAEVAYLGLTVGLGACAFAIAVARTLSRRGDRCARRRSTAWLLATIVIAGLVWLPPVIEQLTSDRGNLSLLLDYFRHPPESPVGLGEGLRVMLGHLNPVKPITGSLDPTTTGHYLGAGSAAPGIVCLIAWCLAAVAAWRLKHRPLLWLHALIALTLLLGVFSISRIFGLLWFYLVLWAWGINALMLLAVGWTLAIAISTWLHGVARQRAQLAGLAALTAAIMVFTALFAVEATSVENPTPRLAKSLAVVVNPTVAALERLPGRDAGRVGRYLVTFSDPAALGSQGFGLMNELERNGFDVGTVAGYRSPVTPHRVLSADDATAVVHLAVGGDIQAWGAKPRAQQIAYFDPRSAKQRLEYQRIRARVIAELQAAGFASQVPAVDTNLVGLSLNQSIPSGIREQLSEMSNLGLPVAVFLAPPTM
jgi:hypothetical protein